MTSINDIIQNETPTDVILALVRGNGISHPWLDNLYNLNDWVFIGDNLQLIALIRKMKNEGLIQHNGNGYIKGPNWREPEFVTLKKYNLSSSS
ncbi:hypothetical protein [Pseudomonas sp. NPDC089406]|uniref:hypothetical protein n=1 Tax=Pseudomonas sp. NPDC089406 TaxID=3364463 RepID=UPI0038508722